MRGVGLDVVARRFEVYLVNLDPTVATRSARRVLALVMSPDEMNESIRTVIVAPMTTKGRSYPTGLPCNFQGKRGQIVVDQIRTVDRIRLITCLGKLTVPRAKALLGLLQELFAE